jgi:hypothetical protein
VKILRWEERLVPVGPDEYELRIEAEVIPDIAPEFVNISVEIGGDLN